MEKTCLKQINIRRKEDADGREDIDQSIEKVEREIQLLRRQKEMIRETERLVLNIITLSSGIAQLYMNVRNHARVNILYGIRHPHSLPQEGKEIIFENGGGEIKNI